MHRSDEAMNSIGNFQKVFVISIVSVAKPKNIFVFALTHMLESFALLNDDFCIDLYSVDSDEALNALSLQILSNVQHFIATIFSEH